MQKLAAVKRNSEHPTALAVGQWTDDFAHVKNRPHATEFNHQPGLGVPAIVDGGLLQAGNAALMTNQGIAPSEQLEQIVKKLDAQDVGSFFVAINGHQIGLIAVEDRTSVSSIS
ncbi:MAG: hypothetical protein KZQ66_18305 [Candidatus Thiodiazotropha sp. (ex Lucinoma aequizonata)]|nr:hypothetical protein [Candidatus Thiodiazotropha sp. (ex Lucinoma aequizonata)]MCU7886913.1 hypothetical protein [Candidatus Thiodiazotropha sp. (ex Lucinoma aequizonata)]MCU7893847.1 hypothetical protein [Candidatus Thiodiazotropha sp. (ex Lucinoma aequizonata)]MCU7899792.1 hypothetical protein [Candidatus Thiodiazotropha sp. (ex Lucinoma aequizonata)]MCU7903690.1 hypothetical protein [Candidatus Thiodiazotropha sp. (ex Lucinoma aequizonata)]